MNRTVQARSRELLDSLNRLRLQSELYRAELYWNVQRILRTRTRTAAVRSCLVRRKGLRIHQRPHHLADASGRMPVAMVNYCPAPAQQLEP